MWRQIALQFGWDIVAQFQRSHLTVNNAIQPWRHYFFPEESLLCNFSSLKRQVGNYYWEIKSLSCWEVADLVGYGTQKSFCHPSPRKPGCHGPTFSATCWHLDPWGPETPDPTPGSVLRALILLLVSPVWSWQVSHMHPLRACPCKRQSEIAAGKDRGEAWDKGAGQSCVCTWQAPFMPLPFISPWFLLPSFPLTPVASLVVIPLNIPLVNHAHNPLKTYHHKFYSVYSQHSIMVPIPLQTT